MEKLHKNKVVCYVTHGEKLLVFRHLDYPLEITGVQVPAGTVCAGERVEHAATRELLEETGIAYAGTPVLLGCDEYDMRPTKNEIQVRHYFHFVIEEQVKHSWTSQEDHDGLHPPTRLECFWMPIRDGHVVTAGRGALLWKVLAR